MKKGGKREGGRGKGEGEGEGEGGRGKGEEGGRRGKKGEEGKEGGMEKGRGRRRRSRTKIGILPVSKNDIRSGLRVHPEEGRRGTNGHLPEIDLMVLLDRREGLEELLGVGYSFEGRMEEAGEGGLGGGEAKEEGGDGRLDFVDDAGSRVAVIKHGLGEVSEEREKVIVENTE
jgi:hypothetical protein